MLIRTAQCLPHPLLNGSTGPEALQVGPISPLVLYSSIPSSCTWRFFPRYRHCDSPSSRTRLDFIGSRLGDMRVLFVLKREQDVSNIESP